MSVAFLECPTFIKEFPQWEGLCCASCHYGNNMHKIYVRPDTEDGSKADWFLCVEAVICCGLYHRVRALPREWWVAKSEALGVRRMDTRGYIYPDSPHKDTDHVKTSVTASKTFQKARAKAEIGRAREAEESRGLRGWLK